MEMFMGINHTGIQIFSVKYSVWINCCRHGKNTEAIIAVKYDTVGKCITVRLRLEWKRILNTFR